MILKRSWPLLLAALVAAAGCGSKRTEIGSLLNNPDRYMDKDVNIAGDVTRVLSIPGLEGLASASAYQVDDGTGRIWVVTRGYPRQKGDKVGVKGRLQGGLELAGERLLIHLREIKHKVK